MEDPENRPQIPISDAATVRTILIEAAKKRRSISYAEVLDALGYRFSRPKMRSLCKTLGAVDDMGTAAGEPELAVLVVRESDRLPGQGWWVSCALRLGYDGLWTGDAAVKFIRREQKRAFDFWSPQMAPAKQKKKPKRAAAPAPKPRKRRARG